MPKIMLFEHGWYVYSLINEGANLNCDTVQMLSVPYITFFVSVVATAIVRACVPQCNCC